MRLHRFVRNLARRAGATRLLNTRSAETHQDISKWREFYASWAAASFLFLSIASIDSSLYCDTPQKRPSVSWRSSSEAFTILTKHADVTGPVNEKLTHRRLADALQAMGLTHYTNISVFRIWAYFESRAVTREEFCERAQRSPFLSALVRQILAREASLHFETPDSYDYSKQTSENYANASMDFSFSMFSEFRQGGEPPRFRDYSYHPNYTRERIAWQDQIIEMTVERHNPQVRPWIVFSCGAMGCGKGYAFEYMSDAGFFPLEKIVRIDPDLFKQLMPEWSGYVDGGYDAGSKTHKESCFIAEICQEVALRQRQNIWVDGSLRDADWYTRVFDDIRERYPHYRIGIFNVHASREVVLKRIAERQQRTGRGVPDKLIDASLNAPPNSMFTLLPLCDWIMRVDNEIVPKLANFCCNDGSGNWDQVRKRFQDISPAPFEFPRALAPMMCREIDEVEMARHVRTAGACIDTPVQVSIGNGPTGQMARQRMGIPKDAHSWAWVTWKENLIFPSGGFVFYGEHKNVVGGLSLVGQDVPLHEHGALDGTIHSTKVIEFRDRKEPYELPESLLDPSRWRKITLPALKLAGALEYAYVQPQELGTGGLGAFAYKMKPDANCGEYIYFRIRSPSSF